MAFSYSLVQQITKVIKNEIEGAFLNRIIHFSRNSFSLSVSRSKSQKIIISLDNSEPFLSLTDRELSSDGTSSNFLLQLRKEISGAFVESVNLDAHDRIVRIALKAASLAFIEKKLTLIVELIPMQPNMFVVDDDNRIIALWRASKSLDVVRPLAIGLTYESPVNFHTEESFSPLEKVYLSNHQNDFSSLLDIYGDEKGNFAVFPLDEKYHKVSVQDIFDRRERELADKRKNELFSDIIHLVNRKNKLIKQKIKRLNGDLNDAKVHLADQNKANAILTYVSSIQGGAKELVTEAGVIQLDPQLSVIENANRYFKKYKKAKIALEELQKQINIASDELEYFSDLQATIANADETDLKEIKTELSLNGYFPKSANKTTKKHSYMPYFIDIDGVKVGFGKNNLQNDELTFKYARPFDTFIHIKGYSGSHVVIFDMNPNPKVLDIAASISLALSHQNDGEVMVAKIKDVKHLDRPGRVKINRYKSLFLRQLASNIESIILASVRK